MLNVRLIYSLTDKSKYKTPPNLYVRPKVLVLTTNTPSYDFFSSPIKSPVVSYDFTVLSSKTRWCPLFSSPFLYLLPDLYLSIDVSFLQPSLPKCIYTCPFPNLKRFLYEVE